MTDLTLPTANEMADSFWQRCLFRWRNDAPGLDAEVLSYINRSYPNNHNFGVRGEQLMPHRQLAHRSKALRRFYAHPQSRLLDLSSSKGFFVLEAAQQAGCTSALGIDVFEHDILVSRTLAKHLHLPNARFEVMRLHELSDRIAEFGGPFDTVLLVNTYQYLFFGSARAADCYLDHDRIFASIRRACSGRLIFNNRIELDDCQNREAVARAGEQAKEYETGKIMAAAERYFTLVAKRVIGRYPLLVFEAK